VPHLRALDRWRGRSGSSLLPRGEKVARVARRMRAPSNAGALRANPHPLTLSRRRGDESKIPDRGSEDDDDGEREQAADDRHHDDVEIALAMGRVADGEQR
jgi:hypothetical protein